MLKLAVVIATRGRADVVRALVAELGRQTSPADAVIISASEPADAAEIMDIAPVKLIFGPSGLSRQRNAALAALPPDIDLVAFFDDDFIPSRHWIERARFIFVQHEDIAILTGAVLADGIKTAGLAWTEGLRIVESADAAVASAYYTLQDNFPPYGCNMAFRRKSIGDITFDERLVLYSWQEDTDFGALVGKNGRMVQSDALWGVHLGLKRGRMPGRKLGYSQIVNPRYLVAKGTMPAWDALRLAAKNIAANAIRSLHPEPYIDRVGRLRGNLLGLWDVITGRWYPERAAEL